MARDVISAKLDIIFKKIFTDNKDMLSDFISGILNIPQEELQEITSLRRKQRKGNSAVWI